MADPVSFPAPGNKEDLELGSRLTPRFNGEGLVPAIATDAKSGNVLMLAWMNAEALALSIETGEAHYYSRSRAQLWHKGATSGNFQEIVEMRIDCDQDAIWLKVDQTGGACHTGKSSCFYRRINGRNLEAVE